LQVFLDAEYCASEAADREILTRRARTIGMTDGWYAGLNPGDTAAGATAIREGSASTPEEWPSLAVEAGFAEDETEYYELLHAATMAATEAAVQEREGADDRQLVHAVRSMDDIARILV
jgi:nucleolar protein 56